MDGILESLNERQRDAVTGTEGYLRVVAGAGSGKTKALAHRYAYLVKTGGIHPRNILCVTFTSKAAGEMKRRVRQLVGDGYDTSLITTYHGFCVRVLRPDMDKLFYPQNFIILDVADQKKILEEIYEELELKLDHASFQKILKQISALKATESYVNGFVDPKHDFTPNENAGTDAKILAMYMQRQKKVFGLDFDDLVNFTFYLFEKHPNVKEKWQEQLHYIQVDEFQDSSNREMRLLDILCAHNENLFVVGDPDQNIYEWRGARVEILVDFDKTHAGTQTVILNRNYRSTPQVLNVANSLIEKNKMRIEKDLFTENASGAPVIHLHARDEKAESEWIVSEIKNAVKRGERNYRDFAMLYRASFLSRFLEQALLGGDIPYQIWGGVRFYDRMEIRDMLAYLRMVAFQDDLSLLRIINVPRRQMGKRRVMYLRACAEEENTGLYGALKSHLNDSMLRNSGAEEFVRLIEYFRETAGTVSPSNLLQKLLSQSGYEQYIRTNGDMERLDNLAELYKTATEFERTYGENVTLEDYLRHVSLQQGEDGADDERDCVRLMTIHAAKGLEFPCVFTVGLTEGIFPSSRTLEERKQAGLEEERRLCFVAITRAKERLYLTESEGFGTGGARKLPSRFLFDIADGLYERVGNISQELIDEMRKKAGSTAQNPARRLEIGQRVEHPLFGSGEVRSTDELTGVNQIFFDKLGKTKPISADYSFAAKETPAPVPEADGDAERVEFLFAQEEPDDEDEVVADEPFAVPETLFDDEAEQLSDADEFFTEQESLFADETEQLSVLDMQPDSEPASPREPVARELTLDPNERNLWKRADVPHSGWTCVGVTDLGGPNGTCGMCGYQTIRYVHTMTHPDYHGTIGAGRDCAGKMEGNPENAEKREREFKNAKERCSRFVTRQWKKSAKGNYYLKYKENIIILLPDKYKPGQWKFTLNGTVSGLFPNLEAAKLGAFDAVSKISS